MKFERRSMSWKGASLAVLAGIALAVALVGCSKSPLAPFDSTSPSGAGTSTSLAPPLVSFGPDGSVSYVTAPLGLGSGEPSVLRSGTLPRSVTTSAKVDGNVGGVLRAGRFSVKIPAGAFKGPATVTISMPDSTLMLCDLSIAPNAANNFSVPATLTADLSSNGITDATGFTMFWFDPTRNTWVNLFNKSTVSGATISTSLNHFSKYATGKAGW